MKVFVNEGERESRPEMGAQMGNGNYGDLHDEKKQMDDKDDERRMQSAESKDLEWGRSHTDRDVINVNCKRFTTSWYTLRLRAMPT